MPLDFKGPCLKWGLKSGFSWVPHWFQGLRTPKLSGLFNLGAHKVHGWVSR